MSALLSPFNDIHSLFDPGYTETIPGKINALSPLSSLIYDVEYDPADFENQSEDSTVELELLIHQAALMNDTTTKVLGLVSGFGAGKTWIVARKAIQLATLNPGCDGIITEPNYPLLTQILIPEMHDALRFFGFKYIYKASESIFYVEIDGQTTRIICKSLERYDRLIGINAAWAIADEFDTTKEKIAYQAYLMLLGRLRAGSVRQLIITTTPEGFKAAYRIFITEAGEGKRLIKARTEDNPFLPEDYIETMRAQYPPELIEAYLNGEFVNLTTGLVYTHFDRKVNHKSVEIDPDELFLVSMDFNVGGCAMVGVVIRDGELCAATEFLPRDTLGAIAELQSKHEDNRIVLYPDASGRKGSTNASMSDIDLLEDTDYGGYEVDAPAANPRVTDRVNAVNVNFYQQTLWVDTEKCPKLTQALEQQGYDDNGAPEKFGGSGTVDDWNDSFGYLVHRRLGLSRPVMKVQQRRMV